MNAHFVREAFIIRVRFRSDYITTALHYYTTIHFPYLRAHMANEVFDRVAALITEIENATAETPEMVEAFRIRYLGSKNILKPLMGEMRNIPNEKKRDFGQLVNRAKAAAQQKFEALQAATQDNAGADAGAKFDLTAPSEPMPLGARHPIALTMRRIISIFERIGFTVAEGPEVEDDWHNFSAMNTPEDHPARDMQDTFYVAAGMPAGPDNAEMLLRTHTSSVQARTMETNKPPIRIIAPGRVYRNETISARSHAQFHQVEGLYIAEKCSFADMKATLLHFAREMYGDKTKIRLRPSYFPFTEPSAEILKTAASTPRSTQAMPSAWALSARLCCSTTSPISGSCSRTMSGSSSSFQEWCNWPQV